MRLEGVVLVVLGALWLEQIHPQVRLFPEPPCDPAVHYWVAENPDGSPEEKAILKRLDAVTRSALRYSLGPVPVGICAGVIYGDRTFIFRAGRKEIDNPEMPDADTLFDLCRVTKVFTGAVLAQLLEEGKVRLDQPVSELLPDWQMPGGVGRPITLQDLATHYSGLSYQDHSYWAKDTLFAMTHESHYVGLTNQDIRAYIESHPLESPPGKAYQYSNLGAGLVGYALAQECGKTYEEMIIYTICKPLDMNDTYISVDPSSTRRYAHGYIGAIMLESICLMVPTDIWALPEVLQGAGALRSTVHDMLKFVRANIDAPEGPLGKALACMQVPLAETDLDTEKIGLMLRIKAVREVPGPVYWHAGSGAGFWSAMAFSKQAKIGVVTMANGFLEPDVALKILMALAQE